MMKIIGKEFEYEVVDGCIGQTDTFTLYECKLPDDKPGILKIAKEVENNGILDREALILGTLLETALKVEKNDAEKGGEKSKLGYQCFFPKLVEYFVSSDQGGRCVLILDFSEVAKKLTDLVPLDHIMSREQKRIDPKTSAWIMGRLLKLLHFANWLGISVTINGDNILINPERHKVVIFDWSKSTIVQGPVQKDISREEISSAAKKLLQLLAEILNQEKFLLVTNSQVVGIRIFYGAWLVENTAMLEKHTQHFTNLFSQIGRVSSILSQYML
jgi:hypothetical protein